MGVMELIDRLEKAIKLGDQLADALSARGIGGIHPQEQSYLTMWDSFAFDERRSLRAKKGTEDGR